MKIFAECEYCGKKFEKKFRCDDDYKYKCMLHELKEHSLVLIYSKDIIKNKINYYNKLYSIKIINDELDISIGYTDTIILKFDIKYSDDVVTNINIKLYNKNYDSRSYLEEKIDEKIKEVYEIYANYLLEEDRVLELQDKFNDMFKIGDYVQKEVLGRKQCVGQIIDVKKDKVKLFIICCGHNRPIEKYEYVDLLEFTCGYYWSVTEKPEVDYRDYEQEERDYWERYHELYKEMRDIYGEDAAAVIRELEFVKGYKI